MAEDHQGKSHAKQEKSTQAQQQVPPTNVAIYPPSPTIHINAETDDGKKALEEKPLPTFLRPEWVIVYMTAIYVAISGFTLWAIKRQADIMESQAKDTKESNVQTFGVLKEQTDNALIAAKAATVSAMAANESAKAANAQIQMMKDKERGRLRIEFDNPDLIHPADPESGYQLPFRLLLDGTTQVYITASSCFVGIHESGDPVGGPWWNSIALPKTITPEGRTYGGYMTILTSENPWGEPFTGVDETRVALVREEKLHIFTRGVIAYDDLFGNQWELRFNGKWKYYWNFPPDSIDLKSGYWESVGDNGEYKA